MSFTLNMYDLSFKNRQEQILFILPWKHHGNIITLVTTFAVSDIFTTMVIL